LFLLGCFVFARSVSRRAPFEANVIRPPGAAFTIEDGRVRNLVQLHVVNKLPVRATFTVRGATEGGEVTIAQSEIVIESLQDQRIPVVINVPADAFRAGAEVTFDVTAKGDGDAEPVSVQTKAPLLGPNNRRR
jgi:hypothetical protein